MNNILELIRNEEVKWVKLGQLGKFYGGLVGKSKNDFINGNKYYVPYKNVFNNLSVDMNYLEKVKVCDIEKQKKLEVGDIIFTGSSENLKEAGLSSVITEKIEKDIYLNSFCFFYRLNDKNILLPNFSKYLFRSLEIRKQIIKCTAGVTRYNVSKKSMENIQIPIPSLELQEKIVDILDRYTKSYEELKECLAKEKDLRIKQYEYYRDKLLSEEYLIKKTKELCGEDTKVEVKTLNEIGIVTKLAGYEFTEYVKYSDEGNIIALRGLNVKKGSLVLDDVKYIDNSKLEKLNRSKLYIDDILYTYVGTVGEVALIDKNDKYYLAPNVALIRINDKNSVLSKYILYYLQSNSFKYNQLNKLLSVSSMKNLTMEKIRLFKILIPPLEVQIHISAILDKYTSSYLQLQSTLSKEIEQRTKQYEYYRELLLNFKKTCQEIF